MRPHLARLVVVVATCAAVVSGGGAAHATPGADLAVSTAFVGQGTPKVAVGETVTYTITLTNLGPDVSAGTFLVPQNPDAFNLDSMTCSDSTFCSAPGGALASGATVTATIVDVVCCFPVGASRKVSAGATAVSSNDPDLTNNTASVPTKIVGPHGFSFA